MPRPIQSQAPAFLNLLGLKNQGGLPPDLAEFVQPGIDMLPFYLRGGAQNSVAIYPAAAVPWTGGNAQLWQVPANEWWYVHMLTARLSWTAATTANAKNFGASVGYVPPAVVQVGPTVDVTLATYFTGTSVRAQPILDIWVPPNSTLSWQASYVDINDGANQVWTAQGELRYTPVPV